MKYCWLDYKMRKFFQPQYVQFFYLELWKLCGVKNAEHVVQNDWWREITEGFWTPIRFFLLLFARGRKKTKSDSDDIIKVRTKGENNKKEASRREAVWTGSNTHRVTCQWSNYCVLIITFVFCSAHVILLAYGLCPNQIPSFSQILWQRRRQQCLDGSLHCAGWKLLVLQSGRLRDRWPSQDNDAKRLGQLEVASHVGTVTLAPCRFFCSGAP